MSENDRVLMIGTRKYTEVLCKDKPGAGGACHEYDVVQSVNADVILGAIRFQLGPIKENGVNGVMNEDLIAIVIDRMEGFQSGDYACHDNEMAKIKLEEALVWLRKRTNDREDRGVEGTSIV